MFWLNPGFTNHTPAVFWISKSTRQAQAENIQPAPATEIARFTQGSHQLINSNLLLTSVQPLPFLTFIDRHPPLTNQPRNKSWIAINHERPIRIIAIILIIHRIQLYSSNDTTIWHPRKPPFTLSFPTSRRFCKSSDCSWRRTFLDMNCGSHGRCSQWFGRVHKDQERTLVIQIYHYYWLITGSTAINYCKYHYELLFITIVIKYNHLYYCYTTIIYT